ncbi:MAG: hypothetical protein H8D78_08355 [Chloroflexi bacterium]|nr:hypothetical protein [Chloroflexota bacterium]
MSRYRDMQNRMARGWNTWNVRSVASHVLLPGAFALNIGLKEYRAGRYFKETLIGRYQGDPGFEYRGGEHVEVATPGPHAYDGSYTELRLAGGNVIKVPDAVPDDAATLSEPLSCAINAQELGGLKTGDRVLMS